MKESHSQNMIRWFVIVALFLIWAHPARAAAPYYEFNPDFAQSLLVASSDTVSEVFLPLNDYLSSFDFWLSNDGTAGNVTFTLYNANNSQVATRTVLVPALANSESGTRFHVNLPVQITVTGTSPYRIQISTAVPTLRLYYADAVTLLAHNGSPLPAYTGGLARIGDEDKGFSFKFALYETAETSPPQLSGVTVAQHSPSEATLTYFANEPVDRNVHFGNNEIDWSGGYSSCAPGIEPCIAILSVIPGTVYPYTLTVRDVWGNQAEATGTFTTSGEAADASPTTTPTAAPSSSGTPTQTVPGATPTPDTSNPFITNFHLVGLSDHSVGVSWTTTEAATSFLVVQSLPVLLTAGGTSDSSLELEHFLHLDGLDPDNTYVANITSGDASGNNVKASISFQTLPSSVNATPNPTATPGTPPGTVTAAGTGTNPVISWSAPASGEPTDGYRIDIFDADNNLIRTVTVLPGQLSVTLGSLPPGNNHVIVYTNNDDVFEKVAAPAQFVVKKRVSLLERIISALPYELGAVAIIIGATVFILRMRKKSDTSIGGSVGGSPSSPPPVTSVPLS